jgi:hypothetical protein
MVKLLLGILLCHEVLVKCFEYKTHYSNCSKLVFFSHFIYKFCLCVKTNIWCLQQIQENAFFSIPGLLTFSIELERSNVFTSWSKAKKKVFLNKFQLRKFSDNNNNNYNNNNSSLVHSSLSAWPHIHKTF